MKILDRLIYSIASIMVGIIFIINVIQVIMRYIFNASLSWPGELSQYLLIWVIFLGVAPLLNEKNLSAFTLLQDKSSNKINQYLGALEKVIVAGISVVLTIYGLKVAIMGLKQTSPSMGVPLGYIYFVVPLLGVVLIYYIASEVINNFWKRGG